MQTFVKNIFNIRMLAGTLFLLSIFKPQVLVKAFFKLDKKCSQTTSEMNKRSKTALNTLSRRMFYETPQKYQF